MIKALNAASNLLWDGRPVLADTGHPPKTICYALYRASKPGTRMFEGARLAQQLVVSRLHPYLHVEKYLYMEVPQSRNCTQPQVQEFRRRWVDALISELEAPLRQARTRKA